MSARSTKKLAGSQVRLEEGAPLTKEQLTLILEDRDYTRLDRGLLQTIILQAMAVAEKGSTQNETPHEEQHTNPTASGAW